MFTCLQTGKISLVSTCLLLMFFSFCLLFSFVRSWRACDFRIKLEAKANAVFNFKSDERAEKRKEARIELLINISRLKFDSSMIVKAYYVGSVLHEVGGKTSREGG